MRVVKTREISAVFLYFTSFRNRVGNVEPSQSWMALIPGIRLLVCVCDPKKRRLIECGADDLKSKRKIRRGEAARNRYRRKASDIAECQASTSAGDGGEVRKTGIG